ncbi:MAG: ferritin family protein [Fibrobacteres bacterium]|nr:ferritin family protein [Fibrobacterota bacterium]
MAYTLNIDEILEVAVRIEQNGAEFYDHAASKSKSAECIKVFSTLGRQEKRHASLFAKWLKNASIERDYTEPDEDVSLYIKTFAENHIFSKKGTGEFKIDHLKSQKGILEFARSIETASITLYHELKVVMPKSASSVMDKIINEERSHYLLITRLLKLLKA